MISLDTSIDKIIDFIRNNPPGSLPRESAGWPNVIEAHRRMARDFAATCKPPSKLTYSRQRGIVIAAGGPKYFPCAWVCINLLRYLGCTLPIELWYLGSDELCPYMRRLLSQLDCYCIDARELEKQYPARILCGWELKPYAALYSDFAEVLFLDADNTAVINPAYLFDALEYKSTGAVFWPDYDHWRLAPQIWQTFGINWMIPNAATEAAFESGQFLVNKARCWRELRMALWYAEYSDFVFRHVYGDKECFHLAWRFLGTPYAMPKRSPGWSKHTILQYDFLGRLIFQHRCQDKWRLAGGNRKNPVLRHEDLCFSFLVQLRKLWDGVPWHNLQPTAREQHIINALSDRRFLYRRVGYDERPICLSQGNIITEGAADLERRWDINENNGDIVLTISSLSMPTCHLRQDAHGIWRGQWLRHEKMPIELIPLDVT